MKQKLLKTMLLLSALVVGLGNAWATDYTYKLEIVPSDFNTTSYAANNGAHSKDAVCTTDNSKTMSVSYTTNQIMQQSSAMQWQKSNGYIYNTTDLGTITSVTVTSSAGTFTTYYGTSEQPSSGTAGAGKGFFKTSVGSATGKTTKVEVLFTISEGDPSACATPTFSPGAGAVARGTEVTISCATGDATIYYTTDGSTPTSSSTPYNPSSKPSITTSTTIKAIAVKDGLEDSDVATAAYTIAKVATPVFSPEEGEVDKDSEITITCATEGATIYYTTDGSEPTASSTAYNAGAKPTIDTDKTIKAIAIKANYIDSDVSSASYTYARVKSYNLVTSVSQIVSGKHYLIASGTSGSGVAVMDYQDTNNRKTKYVSFSGSTLQAKGAREFIIQGPDKGGWYAIYDAVEDGYLYAASSSNNHLKTDAYTSNSPFSITIDGTSYVANIVGQGNNTRNVMQYNSSSTGLFSCYASASQSPVYLFELDGEETPTESVTVGDRGYITYTTLNAVSIPSGLKSYFVTATGADQVTLTETGASVPARTPLVIEAAAGEYELTSVVSPAGADGNLLKEAMSTTTGNGSTIYALGVGKTGSNEGKVGFYLVGSGVKVPAGKAYLNITGGSAKEFLTFDFDDEPTSIEETLSDSPVKGENIYNLAGQRLHKMQKGINIVKDNGKIRNVENKIIRKGCVCSL